MKRFVTNLGNRNYEIPERYRNSFYLVNAAFFDRVNWFLHRAYEICFPRLLIGLKDKEPKLNNTDASEKIRQVIEILDQCNSIIDVRFPIRRENGKREMVRGFRAQYGLYSGFKTCLGGLRLKQDVTRDQMKALAALSTYKHACMGIRLSGGYGGIKIDPGEYTQGELEEIVKTYVKELNLKGFCDGQTDILEPDINVSERDTNWTAINFPQNHDKLMVMGKPITLGGLENYQKMSSQGVFFALDYLINNEYILQAINLSNGGLKEKTFIIQGLGTLGTSLAKYLKSTGAICVGVKEHDGYIHNLDGIDMEELLKHKTKSGSILDFHKSQSKVNDDILKEACDILILAVDQKALNCYVADQVKAKIIVEAVNGAITPTAHRILMGRSKLVLPDIYVSSGQAVASYIEYLLALKKINRDFPVIRRLYKKILESFEVEEMYQVVSSATTRKFIRCEMKPDILTYAIDNVMRATGDELIDICKEFNLNLDLRIAGYIKAINSIHNSVYELKRY